METLGTLEYLDLYGERYENVKVQYRGEKYRDGSRCLRVYDGDGLTLCTLTVNVDIPSGDGEHYWIKTWSENEAVADVLRNSHIFEDTGMRVPVGFVEAELWRLR